MLVMIGSPLHWLGFLAFVLAMLALDLGVFHRKPHEVKVKEALIWSHALGHPSGSARATSPEPCAANSPSPNVQPRSPHDLATEPGVLKRRGVLPFALKSPYALPLQLSPLPRRETVRK